MNRRKDTYRAALRHRPDTAAPASATTITPLDTRYVKVVVELDPALTRGLTGWVGPPLSALLRVSGAVLRPLRQDR